MPKFTLAAGFVKPPISFILGAVFPDLDTVTVLEITEPLADICCAIFEMNFWPLL
jgi:hypothetical protein